MLRRLVARLRLWSADRLLCRLGLAAILGVAAYLRLHDLDLDWFIVDQARDIRAALGIVLGQAFPLVGPEVQGGPAHTWGPLYFYLLAVPLAFSPNPLIAAMFLSILNLAAVYLTYRFGARFFGRGVGLVSAALFATAPLAVVSGRGLWNLAPMPLFALALMYCLALVVIERRSAMIVPAMVILAGIVQLHFSGVAFLAVFALSLGVYRPSVRLGHVALGTAGFVLLLLPYVVAQALDGWRDGRAMLTLSHTSLSVLRLHDIWPSLRPAFFASADLSQWLDHAFGGSRLGRIGTLLQRTEGYLLLVGAGYVGARALLAGAGQPSSSAAGDSKRRGYGLLALWIWTPIVLLLFKRGLRPWYYRDVLYPAPFLAGAILLRDVLTYLAPRLRLGNLTPVPVIAGVGVLLVAVADIGLLGHLRTLSMTLGAMPIPAAMISGTAVESSGSLALMPMRYKERIVRSIVERTPFTPTAFYQHVHGQPFDGIMEDGGFFFEAIASTRSARPVASAGPAPHYAVMDPRLARRIGAVSPLRRVGPFTILEYRPLIDYHSWAYAPAPNAGTVPDDDWVPVNIPTRSIPSPQRYPYPKSFAWRQTPLLLRGVVEVNRTPSTFRLVVALRWSNESAGHRVDECRVNDALAPNEGAFDSATLSGVTLETVFNLTGYLQQGRNVVTCRISGGDRLFDVDVYELSH